MTVTFAASRLASARASVNSRSLSARELLRQFRREEEGSLLIFGLFCFIIMLGLAGVALDLMRFEERRTTLQNTVDRAVLAAADLNQTLPPKEVVKDYFRKAGLEPPTDDQITVEEGNLGEWRTVRANVSEQLPTWFMNMYGIKYLATPAAAVAEERIGQVEISLVLDVSGSMDSNSRLINLIPAAQDFVDTMFDSVEEGKLSISVVPFAAQVSAGADLMSYFDTTNEHSYSNCIEFDPADYSTTDMTLAGADTPRTYQRNGHFDPYTSSNTHNPYWQYRHCPEEAAREILAFSSDRDEIKNFIAAFDAHGNTAIDIGMKWGAALLDPSLSDVVDDMIANGEVDEAMSERPYSFDNDEALKVIVVMSDGANTTEYRLKPDVDSGGSILWRSNSSTYNGSTSTAQYSLYDSSRNQYFIFALNTWRNEPWGDGTYTSCGRWSCTTYNDPGDAVQLTWPEVWNRIGMQWFARYIMGKVYGSATQTLWTPGSSGSLSATGESGTTKDTRALEICSAFKNASTTGNSPQIYTISFEAPSAGISLLRSCASSTSQFYDVDGLEINDAFSAIASSINKLRLTH